MRPRTVLEMPFGLAVLMGVHGAVAGFCAFAFVAAPFGLMDYTINRERVSGLTFIKSAGAICLLAGCVASVIAFALRREKIWAREAVVVCWGSIGLAMALWNMWQDQTSTAVAAAINNCIYVGCLAWYLYGKGSVRAYYAALESAATVASGSSSEATRNERPDTSLTP